MKASNPPMTDTGLVERLRAVESGVQCGPGSPDFGGTTNWYRNPDGPEAASRIEALEGEVERLRVEAEGHEIAFHGIVRAKIEAEERLAQMTRNHDETLRLFSHWRSRAEKAEQAARSSQSEEESR